jgi:hypothetical protein
MKLEGWLEVLDAEGALPHSGKPYPQMTGRQKGTWGVFQDWLEERGEGRVLVMVKALRGGRQGVWGRTGTLRPYRSSTAFKWWEDIEGWAQRWAASYIPRGWAESGKGHRVLCGGGREVIHGRLADAWLWLFSRCQDPTLELPPVTEEAAA